MQHIEFIHGPDATLILMGDPQECRTCGKSCWAFLNRDGRSACVRCMAADIEPRRASGVNLVAATLAEALDQ